MSARNRRLPRHRAWPLTTTDIDECLGPYMGRVTDLRFLTGHDGGTLVLGAEWVAPISRNHGRSMHPDMVGFRRWHADIEALRVIHPGLRTLSDWLSEGGAAALRTRLLGTP